MEPRLITPQENLDSDVIFNTTTSKFQGYNGSAWVDLKLET